MDFHSQYMYLMLNTASGYLADALSTGLPLILFTSEDSLNKYLKGLQKKSKSTENLSSGSQPKTGHCQKLLQ